MTEGGTRGLELRGVTVRHGSVPALSRVTASFPAGEISCVLGENGSGKSTLVALLSGLRRHDEGELLVDGTAVRFRSPRVARAAGIATVWEDLAVAPLLSVWRNFFLGAEPTRGVWPLRRLDLESARATTAREMARVGVPGLDPDQPASRLKAGERQSLAVARALHFGASALVIDEPTAPMTVARQTLFGQAILAARAQGLTVVVVTNNPRYAHLIGDRYLLLADYASYVACQQRVSTMYRDKAAWTKRSILNVARMGKFSSDRTIQQYADEIWSVKPVKP